MKNIQKRLLYFLVGCVGVRTLLVLIAKNIDKKYLVYMGYLSILIGMSFTYIYISDFRDTGVFGDKIWWKNLRPITGLLYFIFAYLAITKNDKAWVPLLLDITIGLSVFIIYHRRKGNL